VAKPEQETLDLILSKPHPPPFLTNVVPNTILMLSFHLSLGLARDFLARILAFYIDTFLLSPILSTFPRP
jgi:hypothetical protein